MRAVVGARFRGSGKMPEFMSGLWSLLGDAGLDAADRVERQVLLDGQIEVSPRVEVVQGHELLLHREGL